MKRLTEKVSGVWQTNYKADIGYIDTNESIYIGNAIDRLAEFEDFMEEQGFESLKELKEKVDFRKRIDTAPIEKAFREKQKIQDKWQKLKEWVENNSNVTDEDYSLIYGFVLDEMEELERE